jgi:hypothetical protein
MGILVVMHYPTSLFDNLADHAYVECGNGGKAWHCWGGNTGGTALRQAPGSTAQADCIAQPDEKAGIRCYLINGVCHQAANRIVMPANITVRGVRGYQVSNALFGTYGHVGMWPCRSQFHQCTGTTGDIPVCDTAADPAGAPDDFAATPSHQLDWVYTQQVLAIYNANADLFAQPESGFLRAVGQFLHSVERVMAFHSSLFAHQIDFHLGPLARDGTRERLLDIHHRHMLQRMEVQAEYVLGRMSPAEYAARFNELTLAFQDQSADAITDLEYETLFELPKTEQVVLADPSIVENMSIG